VHADRLRRPELGEQVVEALADRQQRARLRSQEALLHGMVEERDERLVVVRDVDEPERLGVDAELRPGVDLEELLERADAARQRDEASDSSAMRALRSCIEPTTRRSSRPVCPISRSKIAWGMTPMTSPPAARAASATAPIIPTLPPP